MKGARKLFQHYPSTCKDASLELARIQFQRPIFGMPRSGPLSKFTRQELYELIWSKPASTLSEEFGISDVAIAKRCKRLRVPRPSRGYWARHAAGKNPPRAPLPLAAEEEFITAAREPVAELLALLGADTPLHEIADSLVRALPKAWKDTDGRFHLSKPEWPEVIVSKSMVRRAGEAFHVILHEVEPLGIGFRKALGDYDSGYFLKGKDRLYVKIEEVVHQPGFAGRGRSTFKWNPLRNAPAGRLVFSFKTQRYERDDGRTWTETDKVSLERVLSQVVSGIRRHFVDAVKRRAEEAIEEKKRRVEWARHQLEWREKEAI